MFKTRWTKWIPLSTTEHAYCSYLIMIRANIKTGVYQFKQIEISDKMRGLIGINFDANKQIRLIEEYLK